MTAVALAGTLHVSAAELFSFIWPTVDPLTLFAYVLPLVRAVTSESPVTAVG
jgi:hypothetical protein